MMGFCRCSGWVYAGARNAALPFARPDQPPAPGGPDVTHPGCPVKGLDNRHGIE